MAVGAVLMDFKNDSDAAETSLQSINSYILICQAVLKDLALATLVADIMSRLLQIFASSDEQTPADHFSKQLHTRKTEGKVYIGFCRSAAMTIYLTTSTEMSVLHRLTKFSFGKGERRRLVWPVTNFWCCHSVISPSLLIKIIEGSKFKSLREKWGGQGSPKCLASDGSAIPSSCYSPVSASSHCFVI